MVGIIGNDGYASHIFPPMHYHFALGLSLVKEIKYRLLKFHIRSCIIGLVSMLGNRLHLVFLRLSLVPFFVSLVPYCRLLG